MNTLIRVERAVGSWPSLILSAVLLLFVFDEQLSFAVSHAYYRVFPVSHSWTPIKVWVDSDGDVLLMGVVSKRHDCRYIAPPRAFGDGSKPLEVVSGATAAGNNWPPGAAYPLGPWRVAGGATHSRIVFHHEHECEGDTRVFSRLGELRRPYSLGVPGYHAPP